MEKRDTNESVKGKKRQRLDYTGNGGDRNSMDVVVEDRTEESGDSLERDQQVSFKSAQDIANALDTSNLDLLVQGFTHLREHLKICNRKPTADEETAQVRTLRETCRRVVYEWAERSNGFSSISTAWNNTSSNSSNRLDALIPGTISGLLEVLDSTATHKYGSQLIRMILDGGLLRNVYRAFGTARSSACASTLQLLYQMVVFARGEHADQLRHVFDWSLKTLDTLVHTRAIIVGFSIRRLWIRFVLAFFEVERCKTFGQILGTRKIISSMFQCVEKDTYQELHALLSSIYQHIVLNEDISRAEKTRVFGVQLFGNLAKTCQITQPLVPEKVGVTDPARFIPSTSNQMEEPQIISSDSMCDLVIRFFRGMMTFQGYGICFKQYGLYPATRKWTYSSDNNNEDMHDVATFTKSWSSAEMQDICNSQILRILVICLNPASSTQMAELAVDIMRASPELIAPFWRNYHCSFEPRLSLRYLTNTGLAIKIMSLSLPATHEMDMRHNGPPRLNTLVEHIIPFALDPVLVGRGLSANASALVRYRNLLMLDVALRKLTDARAMIQAETKRASGAEAHKWLQLEQRLLAVVKQRLPQCHHIVSIHHHLMAITSDKKGNDAVDGSEETHREAAYQYAVIGNTLMRVLSGYQIHFSGAVAEARFDFGTLVEGIRLPDAVAALRNSQDTAGGYGAMNAHTLLYLLRALEKTPAGQTKWMNRVKMATTDKGADSGQEVLQHTYLGVILILVLFAEHQELRAVAKRVAVNAFHSTGLFDHDTNRSEAQCWVDAVVRLISPHSERNVMLTQIDKGTVQRGRKLVGMLEDAIMMSSKLPFKYVDRIHAAIAGSEESMLAFSPLLAGVVEAALVKMAFGSKSLGPRLRETISNGTSNHGDISKAIAAEIQVDPMFGMVKEVVCHIAHVCGGGSTTATAVAQDLSNFMVEAARLTLEPRIAKLEGSTNKKEKEKAPAERQFCSMVEQGYLKSIKPLIGYLQSVCETTAAASEKQKPAKSLESSTAKSLKKEMSNMCSNVGANLERFIDTLVTAVREDEATVSSITVWLLKRTQKMDQGAARQAGFIAAFTWITRYYRVCSSKDSLWTMPEFVAVAEEIQQIDDLSFLLVLFRHLIASSKVSALIGLANGSRRLLTHLLLASRGTFQFIPYIALLLHKLQSERHQITNSSLNNEAIAFVFALARTSVKSLSDRVSKERALETFVQAIVNSQYQLLSNPAMDFEATVLMKLSVNLIGDVAMARRIWTPLAAKVSDRLALSTADAKDLMPIVRIMSPAINGVTRSQLVDSLLALISKGIEPMVAGTILELVEDLGHQAVNSTSTAIEKLRSQLVSKWLADLPNESADNMLEEAVKRATRISTGIDSTGLLANINSAKAVLGHATSSYAGKDNDAKKVELGLGYLWKRASSSSSNLYEADYMKRQILGAILRFEPVVRHIASEWVERMLDKRSLKGEQLSLLVWMAYSIEASSDANGGKLCIRVGQQMFGKDGASLTAKWIQKMAEGDVSVKKIATSFILCNDVVFDEVIGLCRAVADDGSCPLDLAAEVLNSLASRCYNHHQSGADVELLVVDAIPLVVEFINKRLGELSSKDQQTNTAAVVSVNALCQAISILTKAAKVVQDTDSIAKVQKTCLEFVDSVISDNRLLQVEAGSSCKSSAYRLVALICVFASRVNGDHSSVELKTAKQWFLTLRRLLTYQEFSKWAQTSSLRDPLLLTVHGMWTLSRGAMSKWSVDVEDYLALDELEALAGAYTGSIAAADRLLLELMREYEQLSGQSVQRTLLVFGSGAAAMYDRERASRERYGFGRDENVVGVVDDDTVARALNVIDSARMRHTAANFPIHGIAASDSVATLEDVVCCGHEEIANDSVEVYDSQFAMAWVWTLVSARDAVVDMRQVIECGAVAVALSGLSSACERTRKLAYFTMDVVYKRISEATALSGRRQCLLALDSLRNAITERTDTEFPLSPFPTVQFIASALSAMLRPTHPLFADANRQLLRRMYVRLTDLPLLRAALRPSARMERAAVLRITADAARAYDRSISAYSRTDCLNAMLALASSPLGDVSASMSALTLLFHITSANNPRALELHVAGRGMPMLPWVQLQITREANGLAAATAEMCGDDGKKGELYRMRAAIGNITALVRIVVRAVSNYPLVHRDDNGSSPLIERFWVSRSNGEQRLMPSAPGQSTVASIVVLVLKSLAQAFKYVDTTELQLETVSAVLILVSTCVETFHLLATLQQLQTGKDGQIIGMAQYVVRYSLSILTCLETTVIDQEWKNERSSPAVDQTQLPVSAVLSAIAQAELPESLFYSQAESVCMGYRQCIGSLSKWCLHPAAAGSTCKLTDSIDIISRAMAIGAPIVSNIESWVNEFQDLAAATSPLSTPLDVKFRQGLELSK